MMGHQMSVIGRILRNEATEPRPGRNSTALLHAIRIAGLLLIASAARGALIAPVRVACLGDRISAGVNLPDPVRDAWPGQLDFMLGPGWDVRSFCGLDATVLRRGDFPFAADPAFAKALDFTPDCILAALGTNDTKSWNWTFEGDFIADYTALADTFLRSNSNAVFFACAPPPVFWDQFGIRDAVITAGVVPKIDSAAAGLRTAVVDFNGLLGMAGEWFEDGMHPGIEASRVMAGAAYEALTGWPILRIGDPDLAAGRPVMASGFRGNPPEFLNDGDPSTAWTTAALNAWAVIDLGSTRLVDWFLIDFGKDRTKGILYAIQVSPDSAHWSVVVDRRTDPDISAPARLDVVAPVEVRYVRLLIDGAVYSDSGGLSIYDFRVRGGGYHAPAVTWSLDAVSPTIGRYRIYRHGLADSAGSSILYRAEGEFGAFEPLSGYRLFEPGPNIVLGRPGDIHRYFTRGFRDGIETLSDTLQVRIPMPNAVPRESPPISPSQPLLVFNFPNPFNASTRIAFDLPESGSVRIEVLDAKGRRIRGLTDGSRCSGPVEKEWDGSDDAGIAAPSGVYVCRVIAGPLVAFRKMCLVR
jgi:acyl-CoA thioesterase I